VGATPQPSEVSVSSFLFRHRDLDPGRVQVDGRILSAREREIIVCELLAVRKQLKQSASVRDREPDTTPNSQL
jgi:hypothetical protein